MLFNSLQFILFFVVVFVLYYVICDKYRYIVLLIASYLFYGIANIKYLPLLVIITLITYFGGILIKQISVKKQKKIILLLTVVLCLSFLLYFKYFNFLLESINYIFLSNFSIKKIIIPLGLSFFCLQAISYPIDVYRKDVEVEKKIFRYALFVSFFPQILSGPIGKSKEMLKQFREEHKFNIDNVYSGFMIAIFGYFQKIVIADLLAYGVNNVYNNLHHFSGLPILIVVFMYSFQIYFDFASYSNIARGCAKMLGYDLINNFNSPYFADSIKNFWSRWHISLSTWFRDYLYFPLGGNRKGKIRTCINIMIVFIISGLWHGASYTYIVWGLLHGIFQVIDRLINKKSNIKILNIIFTFLLVTFAWIFFRANTINDAFYVLNNMFNINFLNIKSQIASIGFDKFDLLVLIVSMLIVFAIELINQKRNALKILKKRPVFVRYMVILFLIFSIIVFGYYGPGFEESQFIYLGY